ncbi:uncharacterized protein CC84DRAFT_787433 [Paraphaeosphaeria sporulosa]|uniref:Uncharacterized protein n=1 Tax=Paraphaeosphaeria sporulosa TaxID=1460663 RepID=A0A177CBS9_9PLEO|nr:uncharacterized protein CC84DRAFT_787433 [Paraphaeosphaeria sporulosa]OAG04322.1 hypothetical protein CC84DRAFT_787433 [Paraphaeosphaeria sporulosa]
MHCQDPVRLLTGRPKLHHHLALFHSQNLFPMVAPSWCSICTHKVVRIGPCSSKCPVGQSTNVQRGGFGEATSVRFHSPSKMPVQAASSSSPSETISKFSGVESVDSFPQNCTNECRSGQHVYLVSRHRKTYSSCDVRWVVPANTSVSPI